MTKVKESIEDLERQEEDIENLLSSLEASFKEGSIPEEHYNEVKQKNAEKLQEIKKKISFVQRQTAKESQTSKKEPSAEEPPKEKEEKPGILGEFVSKASKEKEEAGEEKIKEKIITELAPKIEKINVRLVKLKAYVDAMKEDKISERESSQRITEEVGETRSSMNSMEGRVGEIEMKLEDVSETLADLKPQKFSKDLQKKDEEIKMHEARLEKLDDMNSTILKRVNQIQIILEKLGNIESMAEMTKGVSKKLVSIDERENKIARLADKIDSMFVEMNKRLEEFMFYKAKQDSLDDLSKEMLKSIDELTTKLTRYAEKDDLELLRDTLENKMNVMSKEAVAPSLLGQQAQRDRSEIESLMKLLDEQFRKGRMSKKDYEKAKEANTQRLRQIVAESIMSSQPAPEETIIDQTPPIEEELPSETEEPIEPEEPVEESGLSQAAKIAQTPPETPTDKPGKKQSEPEPEPEPKQEKSPLETMEGRRQETPSSQKEEPIQPQKERKTEKTISKDELAKKIGRAGEGDTSIEGVRGRLPASSAFVPESKPPDKKQKMLADLEYSFRKGLISQKAYETTQRIIMAKRI
jgi:hypothetical protein